MACGWQILRVYSIISMFDQRRPYKVLDGSWDNNWKGFSVIHMLNERGRLNSAVDAVWRDRKVIQGYFIKQDQFLQSQTRPVLSWRNLGDVDVHFLPG
jgi:hypothetical protein